jgi:hypothetical protein
LRETLGASVGRTVVEDEILSLDVAKLAQALSKGIEIGGVRRRWGRLQHTDTPDPARLLCARSKRQRGCRAAEQSDEVASPHGAYP